MLRCPNSDGCVPSRQTRPSAGFCARDVETPGDATVVVIRRLQLLLKILVIGPEPTNLVRFPTRDEYRDQLVVINTQVASIAHKLRQDLLHSWAMTP